MGKRIRVLYLGNDPGGEYKKLGDLARLAYDYAGTGILQLNWADTFGEFKSRGGRIGAMDLIYVAGGAGIDDVLIQRAGKCDERLRGDFGAFYREVCERIAHRLDNGFQERLRKDGEKCVKEPMNR